MQLLHPDEPTYSFAQPRQPNGKCPDHQLFNKIQETGLEEIPKEESHDHELLFHGFLSIGTLGSESFNTDDPPTPTFSMSFDQDMTTDELETNITENEVELIINSDLEKFLSAEAKEVTDESSTRSSQVSIITFSNTELNDADSEQQVGYSPSFPLQNYIFWNSIKLPVTALKKEKDKSPEKLLKFSRSYATMHFTKNILKKLLRSAGTCCTTASSASNEKATKTGAIFKRKLPKVLKLKFFNQKVHPAEGLIAENQYIMPTKEEIKKVSDTEDGNGEQKRSPNMATLKKEIFNSVPFSERININGTKVNRERWITTDDDYLVLEL